MSRFFRVMMLVFLVIFAPNPSPAAAGERSAQEADTIAGRLIEAHIAAHGDWAGATSARPADIEILEHQGALLGYFITVLPTGYIMVAADERLYPVRAYSAEGGAEEPGSADPLKSGGDGSSLIKGFLARDVQRALVPGPEASAERSANHVDASGSVSAPMADLVVGPLTNSAWHQGDPFNAMLPLVDGERPPAGCGPVAVAQLLYYWRTPERIAGPHSYLHSGTELSIVDTTPYDWKNIKADYGYWGIGEPEELDAVAKLLRHVAFSLEAQFSASRTSTSMLDVEWVLKKFFDYSEDTDTITRGEMTAEALMRDVLLPELQKSQPCLYGIYEDYLFGEGHATVVDGYERIGASGEFEFIHLNFGWGDLLGTNSWYHPDRIAAGGTSFDGLGKQVIVRNIRPFDRLDWNETLEKVEEGETSIETDRFSTAALGAGHVLVIYDLNPDLTSLSNWAQAVVDLHSNTISHAAALDISSSFLTDPPIVLKINQTAYALVYESDSGTAFCEIRDLDGTKWNLSNNQLPFMVFTPLAATCYQNKVVVASTRINASFEYQPFLYVYDYVADSGSTVDLGSATFADGANPISITPLNSGTILSIYQADNAMYAYFSNGADFTAPGTPVKLLEKSGLVVTDLTCQTVQSGFILAWRDDLLQKIEAQSFDLLGSPVENRVTLESYSGVGMAFDVVGASGDQFVLAAEDGSDCLLQAYELNLDRSGCPMVTTSGAYLDAGIHLADLAPGKFAVLWLTAEDEGMTPGTLNFMQFRMSRSKAAYHLPALWLLLLQRPSLPSSTAPSANFF